ncbi:MAG: hypothetical protein QG622_2632 [Actinomycetota bacterium]|nr:hypothetical protein [Actinomycetota bacterium]
MNTLGTLLTGALLVGAAAVGPRTDVPVVPDRRQARQWVEEELLGREYAEARPGPVEMLISWLKELLGRLPAPEGVDVSLGVTVASILALLLGGYVLWRTGGLHRQVTIHRNDVFDEPPRSAADHRRAAELAEAAGDLRTALLERFRALVRALSDRALVELDAGRTADELTRRASSRLPSLAPRLAAAGRVFDEVRYGDLSPTPEAVGSLRDLDDLASRTTPVEPRAVADGQPAVPR